eukprot:6206593-Pleurochrysis_carterae.AAC.1
MPVCGQRPTAGGWGAPAHPRLRPRRRASALAPLARQKRAQSVAASSSMRFPSGQHNLSPKTLRRIHSAVAGSPTTIFDGAACRPRSRSPNTASFACTQAHEVACARVPPPAAVWTGSMTTSATLAGGSTSSSYATPVKSSMGTCRHLGYDCSAPTGSQP